MCFEQIPYLFDRHRGPHLLSLGLGGLQPGQPGLLLFSPSSDLLYDLLGRQRLGVHADSLVRRPRGLASPTRPGGARRRRQDVHGCRGGGRDRGDPGGGGAAGAGRWRVGGHDCTHQQLRYGGLGLVVCGVNLGQELLLLLLLLLLILVEHRVCQGLDERIESHKVWQSLIHETVAASAANSSRLY